MSMRFFGLRGLALLSLALVLGRIGLSTSLAPLRDQDPPTTEQIDQWIEHARNGRPAVRPQAAQRLVRAREVAAPRLLELAGQTTSETAALGAEIIEILGAFESAPLREKLLAALADEDFPWRPAAARGLAAHPLPADRERITPLLGDPLAAVRAAAIDGMRALDLRDDEAHLIAALSDEDDRVRRRAAVLLSDWNERWALEWLIEDLARNDSFFDRATGQMARYEAWNFLKPRLGQTATLFQPDWAPTDANAVEARSALRASLPNADNAVPIPKWAAATHQEINEVLGLELRSCRKGEYFLRWNANDELWIGLGTAVRVALPEGSSARILKAAANAFESLGDERFFGTPGCDLEDYLWRPPGAQRATVYRLSKGPQPVDGLRPTALSELAQLLVSTIPEEFTAKDLAAQDPRTNDLAERIRAALLALGGEFKG